jgi:acyl-CoA oxidase
MVGTLVSGRVSVALAATSATKSALTIAIRYGATRRQFGAGDGAETRLLDYLAHQRRLLPALATTYALHVALADLVRRFLARTDADQREMESLAAGLKAYATWHATSTIQTCREACGGQGYIAANRFAALKADTDVFTTFEGDNTVLMQLVARGLLTEYKEHFSVMRYLAQRAATTVADLDPVSPRLTDDDHLRGAEFQLGAVRYRETRLLGSVARRIKGMVDDGQDSFSAANAVQDHLLHLAHAHVERVIGESLAAAVAACDDKALASTLALLRDTFVLSRLEADRAWYLEAGYFAPAKSRAVRALINRLLGELRRHAVPLVNAFGIPDALLDAPIAPA